jgi:hypothetical protein
MLAFGQKVDKRRNHEKYNLYWTYDFVPSLSSQPSGPNRLILIIIITTPQGAPSGF